MPTLPNVPTIDSRVRVVGIAHLRKATAEYLGELGDNALLVQGNDDKPLVVVVSYATWLDVQKQLKGDDKMGA